MSIAGLTLPMLSAFDPPVAGEGSLDPLGLAAISDRLADQLVPGLRSRMLRIRFVTAIAVGATACETLQDVPPADDISTPAICFEWLVVEAFARRIPPNEMPTGVPGSQKARSVINRGERLSAPTYLKGPSVFGFNGVYKPFAIDSGVVTQDLEPGPRCAELVRAWEDDAGYPGFCNDVPGTPGASLRKQITQQVLAALQGGRCTTGPGSWLFGNLAAALHPDHAPSRERSALRSLVLDSAHLGRTELARLVGRVNPQLDEAAALRTIRHRCSLELGLIVDAVMAYEAFAAVLDTSFRTLCAASRSLGTQPLTPKSVENHDTIRYASRYLPALYKTAADSMSRIDADAWISGRLADFAVPHRPQELVALLFEQHEQVQAAKPPQGKRPWFEPLRDGFVVRPPYAFESAPALNDSFVHPVRVAALQRFMIETAP